MLDDSAEPDDDGFVAVGADLEPSTLIAAYRAGLFPMPIGRRRIGWFSPDPRGVIPLDGLRISRSLRRSCARYEVTVDESFRDVMTACGDPRRPHGWINDEFLTAYVRLHGLGWAHSFESRAEDGRLVGGLYGIRIGRFFAGESMFSLERDASKVALVALIDAMNSAGMELLDVQWLTPHLASLGAIAIARADYLGRLGRATMVVDL
jgi:leucyl/phenylalanyl-tRNA--protein transferase